MAKLRIRHQSGEEKEFILSTETILLGKNDRFRKIKNDLIFEDETVSRRHARIYCSNGNFFIEDLGSRNHTYVNDDPIKKARLRDNDRIRIGFNTLIFEGDQTPNPLGTVEIIKPTTKELGHTLDFNYLILHHVRRKFSTETNVTEIAEWLIKLACQLAATDKGMVVIQGPSQRYRAFHGRLDHIDEDLVDRVFAEGEIFHTSTGAEDTEGMPVGYQTGALACLPIMNTTEIFGAFYLENHKSKKFSAQNIRLLNDLASHVAAGLEKLFLDQKVQTEQRARQNMEDFLKTLQKNEHANRALLNAIPDLMMTIHQDGTVLTYKMPKNAIPIFKDDIPGQKLHTFLPEAVNDMTLFHIAKALHSGTVQVFQFELEIDSQTRYYENRLIASGKAEALSIIRDITTRVAAEQEKENLITELRSALAKIKTLRGLIPICSCCKKIRDDKGYWNKLELYLQEHSEAEFSHGICENCMEDFYPQYTSKSANGVS